MVTKWLPLPADDGGKQRSLAVLEALAAEADVTLVGLDDGRADHAGLAELAAEVRSAPRPGLRRAAAAVPRAGSLSAARFYDPGLADEVRRASRGATAVVVEYLQMAPYARGVRGPRRVLDLHNIESSLVGSYARVRGGAVGRLAQAEVSLLRRAERRAVGTFDRVCVVSTADAARLPGSAAPLVCPNGCRDRAALPPSSAPAAAFVAMMGWTPNVDAAVWLVEEVWPLVRALVPAAELALVGRSPAERVRALAAPGITVTGTVPDVAPHLQHAAVALAPLRMGGGSRLKILEALVAGRPVVATPQGVEGLEDLIGEGVVVAGDPPAFARALADLLLDPTASAALGARGRAAVRARYLWEATLRPLVAAALG